VGLREIRERDNLVEGLGSRVRGSGLGVEGLRYFVVRYRRRESEVTVKRRGVGCGFGCRFMVYGLWFMVYGLWFMVYGLWFMVYGLWFLVYGLGNGVEPPRTPGGRSNPPQSSPAHGSGFRG